MFTKQNEHFAVVMFAFEQKLFFFCYFTVVPMTLLMDLNEVKWLVIIFSLIDLILIFYVCLPLQTKRGYFWD